MADLGQFEAAVSLFLQDSELEEIKETDDKIFVKIIFPQSYESDFSGYKSNPEFDVRFRNYLKVVLGKETEVQVELSEVEDSPEIKRKAALRQYTGTPEYDWRVEQEENPILKQMQDLLKLDFIGSRKTSNGDSTNDLDGVELEPFEDLVDD